MLPSAHDIVVKPEVPVVCECHIRRSIPRCKISACLRKATLSVGTGSRRGGFEAGRNTTKGLALLAIG